MILRALRVFALLLVGLCPAAASAADVGAIVMHGKWGMPDRNVKILSNSLERASFLVATPEMPWSRQRLYDKPVQGADDEIDREIARLTNRGAKRIFLVGHSLGAAYALHYGQKAGIAGIVAIAPGHRPEVPRIADMFRPDVTSARQLVAAGKGSEMVTFMDFNTGNRRERLTATAVSFLSYFDPDGPLNMSRNASTVKADIPMLWVVPLREEPPLRQGIMAVYKRFPSNALSRLAEPDADHMGAPAVSVQLAIEWMRGVASTSGDRK